MKSLKDLRAQLGLSQRDLAEYLRIARSGVARIEKGQRSMRSSSMIKVGQLLKYMNTESFNESVKARGCLTETELSWHKANCAVRLQICTYNIAILERKLSEYEYVYNQNVKLHEVLKRMQKETETENYWILMHLNRAEKKMRDCGLLVQETLRERLHMLKAEEDYLNQFLKKKPSSL